MIKNKENIIYATRTEESIVGKNGIQYFVCGKNRIKISEHFTSDGYQIGDLIIDVVRHVAVKGISP